MVSAEFNLLYRFHGPISKRDAKWTEDLFVGLMKIGKMVDDNATKEQQCKGEKITTQMVIDGEVPIAALKKVMGDLKEMKKKRETKPKIEQAWFPAALDMVGDPEGKGWFRGVEHCHFLAIFVCAG